MGTPVEDTGSRGQRLQFGIIALMALGVSPVLYATAYGADKRWPSRRTNSLEYRAHLRHQKEGTVASATKRGVLRRGLWRTRCCTSGSASRPPPW